MVFIDYQNVYRNARRTFGADADDVASFGQIDPLQVGLHLADLAQGQLAQVRIYRGMPNSNYDPPGNSAARRQVRVWNMDQRVVPVTRPLRYPKKRRGGEEEKGIDVALAVDYVRLAMEDKYDVGIIFSSDTDLLPALELVLDMSKPKGLTRKPRRTVQVATWTRCKRLTLTKPKIWCHVLDFDTFSAVQDKVNYARELPPDKTRPHP